MDMDTGVLNSIVGVVSALLGVALTSILEARKQRNSQHFQLLLEGDKRQSDMKERNRALALERLNKAHRQLSMIDREFSVTSFNIMWRARISSHEYDQRYLSICTEVDELRVIACLYEPALAEDIEKLCGQMSTFWGNFNNVLYLEVRGTKVDHNTSCFQRAHDAALDVGRQVSSLKNRIADLASRHQI